MDMELQMRIFVHIAFASSQFLCADGWACVGAPGPARRVSWETSSSASTQCYPNDESDDRLA